MNYPEDFINKVICGDCLEVMKDIPDKSIDLVLTDPPYGITKAEWDKVPSKEYFDEIFRISKEQLFFGGQFFDLPKKEGWIIWDKRLYWFTKDKPFAKQPINEADLIWLSRNIKTKIIEFHSAGNIEGFKGEKLKPDYGKSKNIFTSQKPIRLVAYLIKTYFPEAKNILDPFLGSGTTAVAAKHLKRNFIGIEISPEYCKIAEDRLGQELLF